MNGSQSSVVVMCCDGTYQRHLIRRVSEEFDLLGVILHKSQNAKGTLLSRASRYKNPLDLIRYLKARRLIADCETQAKASVDRLFHSNGRELEIPDDVPIIDVENVNNQGAVRFLEKLNPDLVCVNGTNLLRKPLLDLIPRWRLGCINLHTGLSPYSRGGNCNLFMLIEGHPELVGLTIHHIDSGIDSGDIIITARPELEPNDSYEIIEAKTFYLGIELMLVAIRQLQEGRAQRVKQWETGKLFLKRTGYVYNPYQRVRVNRLLEDGLIVRYIANRERIDAGVRLIGEYN
jgi:methionyl-tRNA formyltransferase